MPKLIGSQTMKIEKKRKVKTPVFQIIGLATAVACLALQGCGYRIYKKAGVESRADLMFTLGQMDATTKSLKNVMAMANELEDCRAENERLMKKLKGGKK